jgi:hypothetical protein
MILLGCDLLLLAVLNVIAEVNGFRMLMIIMDFAIFAH